MLLRGLCDVSPAPEPTIFIRCENSGAPEGAGRRFGVLGATAPGDAVHGTGAVWRAISRAQGLRASFASSGVTVTAGSSRLGIDLQAVGIGRAGCALRPRFGRVVPEAGDRGRERRTRADARQPAGDH